jgi:nucleotide-binding universal stress UspA family protein
VRGPIVVGADGSDNSPLAIEEAASIAKGSGQTVVVAYVRHTPLAGFGVPWTGGLSVGFVQGVLNANESFVEAESIAILDSAGVHWRFEVREGEPATELMRLATAAGADTIVVAGRRHRALGSMACASVCAQLLHRWPRSLLVIHPHTDVMDADSKTASGDQQ